MMTTEMKTRYFRADGCCYSASQERAFVPRFYLAAWLPDCVLDRLSCLACARRLARVRPRFRLGGLVEDSQRRWGPKWLMVCACSSGAVGRLTRRHRTAATQKRRAAARPHRVAPKISTRQGARRLLLNLRCCRNGCPASCGGDSHTSRPHNFRLSPALTRIIARPDVQTGNRRHFSLPIAEFFLRTEREEAAHSNLAKL